MLKQMLALKVTYKEEVRVASCARPDDATWRDVPALIAAAVY